MKIVLPALIALLGACAAHRAYDYLKEPDPRRSEYVIGASDRLSIQVWKSPDLSRDVTVRPDGTITLPLIGDLAAEGRTPSELKGEISSRLAKFVRDESAVVTIAVVEVNSYTFTVSGNVEKPGVFTSRRYVTVLEAIQMAGGLNRFASPGDTRLLRRGPGGTVRIIPIDYPSALEGSRPEANLALMAGDQLYVP